MGMLIMIAVSIVGAIIIAYITQYVGHLLEKRWRQPAHTPFVHNPGLFSLGVVVLSIGSIVLVVSCVAHNPIRILGLARDLLIFGGTTVISLFAVDRLIARM